MTEDKLLEQIKPFTDACDKMIASKFIMIDKRISDVLKSIASTKPVFDLVKRCMINFNFEREYRLATAKMGVMYPPEEVHQFIAFVFSLLNNIDNKKLNASEVLSRYFKGENNQGPYNQFCLSIILEFKNAVIYKLLNKPEARIEAKKLKEEETYSVNKEVLKRLEFLVKDLKEYVMGLKKLKKSKITKGELLEIINGLIDAIKDQQVRFIKPFIYAIKTGFGKDKEIERRLIEILDIVNKTI